MRIGAVIPCLDSHGSARRFVELGNELIKLGHEYQIADLTKARPVYGIKKDYDPCPPVVASLKDVDHIMFMAPSCLDAVIKMDKRREKIIWWWITSAVAAKKIRDRIPPHWNKICNNVIVREKDYPDAYLLTGGVGEQFQPRNIRVGFHARKSDCVRKSLCDLDHIELVPMQNIIEDTQLVDTYRSLDYFVSHETVGGWANMAAEALACGVPVVSWLGKNCEAFKDRVIIVSDIKEFFVDPLAGFRYRVVAEKLEGLMENRERRDHIEQGEGSVLREPEDWQPILTDLDGR